MWRSIWHRKKSGDFLRTVTPLRDDGDEEHRLLDQPRTKLKMPCPSIFSAFGPFENLVLWFQEILLISNERVFSCHMVPEY
jgi:hypothetical protein